MIKFVLIALLITFIFFPSIFKFLMFILIFVGVPYLIYMLYSIHETDKAERKKQKEIHASVESTMSQLESRKLDEKEKAERDALERQAYTESLVPDGIEREYTILFKDVTLKMSGVEIGSTTVNAKVNDRVKVEIPDGYVLYTGKNDVEESHLKHAYVPITTQTNSEPLYVSVWQD